MTRFPLSALLLACALPLHAQNQNPPTARPPAAPNPAPATNPVLAGAPSVLVLALDDLVTSSSNLPILTPENETNTGILAPAAAIAPLLPAPNPAAIAPTFGPIGIPELRVLAQRKPKEDKDAALFAPVPDRGGPNPIPAPDVPTDPLVPTVQAPEIKPPGRAGLTAIALRRALLTRGFGDVQTAAPDSPVIARALNEKRLSLRVIDDLKRAIFALSAPTPPTPTTISAATRAATRIGQAVGYRAVVVVYVGELAGETEKSAPFTMLLADALAETGEPIAFDEKGASEATLHENGAIAAAALLSKSLQNFAPVSAETRAALAQKHFLTARGAFEAGRIPIATDEINQAIALNERRHELWVLRGQILEVADPEASAGAFRRALELNPRDGESFARLAKAYAYAKNPSWPQVLDAGRKAIAVGFDSPDLRVAMATAQYGRATLFRRADRLEQAEDAEIDARSHLDRALEMAPDDSNAIKILTRALLANRNFEEALQTLDRVGPRFPKDAELQTLYANALVSLPAARARQEDAFLISSRVWRLTAKTQVDLDPISYRTLAEGFDLHITQLGRTAAQLTGGVLSGTLAQESAFLQLSKLSEEMKNAAAAINAMRVTGAQNTEALAARQFAADLMSQAIENQSAFLETGQKLYRDRGLGLTQNAITQLNAARTAG